MHPTEAELVKGSGATLLSDPLIMLLLVSGVDT